MRASADDRKGRPYDIIDGAVPSPPSADGTSPRGGGKEEADGQRSPLRSVEDWRVMPGRSGRPQGSSLRYTNDYDGKLNLLAAVTSYLAGVASSGVIDDGFTVYLNADKQRAYLKDQGTDVDDMTDEDVLKAYTATQAGADIFQLRGRK